MTFHNNFIGGFLALLALSVLATGCRTTPTGEDASRAKPVEIGQRLELFVDHELIGKLEGVEFRLHEPQALPPPENPLPGYYTTVIKDGDLYRGYYRDIIPGYDGARGDGHGGEITCYAESRDGHEWHFPELGITDVRSSMGGNVILANAAPSSHNFTPFIDTRPGAKKDERFKALGGTHPGGGVYAFRSADGIHWGKIQEAPVLTSEAFAFDSQNVAFWSEAEGRYVCYFRTWETPHGKLRTISRATSADFINWSEPVATNPNRPGEHLYTNQTHPYFRAPHLYVSLPTRFMPHRGNSTDILFMATRAGSHTYDRLFTEAFIRPGLDPARWGNRSNYVALTVVPTGPAEMSIYHKSGHRYVLRTDGFISLHADSDPGEVITRPLTFSGDTLLLNFSTSAAGSLRVELQDAAGLPLPGFSLADSPPIVGDAIQHVARWEGEPDLAQHAGKAIRIRFVMTECDLYSIQFREL